MENSLTIALARQTVLGRQMDVIATNLANLNTGGYRGDSLLFKEYLAETEDGEISLVHDVAQVRNLDPGPIVPTHNPLDLALEGEGYFVVETPEGLRYTRNGAFRLDAEGRLVTTAGESVLGEGDQPIVLPTEDGRVAIATDGQISTAAGEVAKLKIVRFADEAALEKQGAALYDAGEQEPEPATEAQVVQGAREGSNVNGVAEISRMIDSLRAYQAAASLTESEHKRILAAVESLVSVS